MTIKSSLGIDVSKASVTIHLLEVYPKGGLRSYWDKTRNKQSNLYPCFCSNPDSKKRQKSAFDFADYVQEVKPDIAIMEPTGSHYSRIWARILEESGIKILWIGHMELRRYRQGKNLPNKSDAADALALAAYPLDEENHLESGELNLKRFLMHRPEAIDKLRDLCQQLEHLNRVQSPIINYARQMLSWQFPEVAATVSVAKKEGNIPPLWGYLAMRSSEISKRNLTILERKYQDSIAQKYGIEIDPFLRLHADWLCDIALEEQRLEAEIKSVVKSGEFKEYNRVFDKFGFGLRIRARLLTRIYPFENFLVEGKPFIEYEVREVKKVEKCRKNGQIIVKRSPGETKRIKRNRSRDTFKLRLGMGTILEQSGDELVEKPSGSSLCRMTLWQHILCQVEPSKLPVNEVTDKLIAMRDELKSLSDASGQQLLNGKHLQGKLMAKVCNLLFTNLVKMEKFQ